MQDARPIILTHPSFASMTDFSGIAARSHALMRFGFRALRESARHRIPPWRIRSGHSGVTDSLLQGLQTSAIACDFNPLTVTSSTPRRIGILAGLSTLEWAVSYAERHENVYLYVGPNVVVSPLQAQDLLESNCVKRVIVPSDPIAEFYKSELPSVSGKLHVWPAGVDTDYWIPNTREKSRIDGPPTLLMYLKSENHQLIQRARRECQELTPNILTIRYGSYSRRTFRQALQESDAMVVVGGHESQGLFMLEAWSMNVPTLVHRSYEARVHVPGVGVRTLTGPTIASPYLTSATGRFWDDPSDLVPLLEQLSVSGIEPRSWILKHAERSIQAKSYFNLLMR